MAIVTSHQDQKLLQDAFNKARILHQQGQLQDAELMYRKLLKLIPNHPELLHFLGLIHMQTGRFEEAVALIGKSVEINPNQPNVHGNLASVLFQLGHVDAAKKHYTQALKLNPKDLDAAYNFGLLYRKEGLWEELSLMI